MAQFFGCDKDEVAQRFVSCANACSGVSDYGLVAGAVADMCEYVRKRRLIDETARSLWEQVYGV